VPVDIEAGGKAMHDLMCQGSVWESLPPFRQGGWINQAKACAEAWGLKWN
jgi:hypothetical protein